MARYKYSFDGSDMYVFASGMAIIGDSIQYIEEHITEDVTADEVAKAVGVSPFYFQKGFAMLCGFGVAEYIRNRRLTGSWERWDYDEEALADQHLADFFVYCGMYK